MTNYKPKTHSIRKSDQKEEAIALKKDAADSREVHVHVNTAQATPVPTQPTSQFHP